MTDPIQEKLHSLGVERLAEELLKLSQSSDEVERLVQRLIAGPEESIALFKKNLSAIKRRKRFVPRAEASHIAHELLDLLRLLENVPAEESLPLLVKLYQSDSHLGKHVDDSYGTLGDFYREVTAIFCQKAKQSLTQAKLTLITKRILKSNDYGYRDSFSDHLDHFLNKESLGKLFDYYRENGEGAHSDSFHYKDLLKTLALKMKEPKLYEKLVLEDTESPHDYHFTKIASAYFDSEDAQTALQFMRKCSRHEEADACTLLKKIYLSLEMDTELTELITRKFKSSPSLSTYNELRERVGDTEADVLLEESLAQYFTEKELNLVILKLLLKLEKPERAATYLLNRSDLINGDLYYTLPDIATLFTELEFPLPATLISRALMTSVLEQAITKNYGIAVRYLRTLKKQQDEISDWQGHPNHADFLQDVHKNHYRKSSFWKKVPDDHLEGLQLR